MKKFLILLPLLFALPACTQAERKGAVNDVGAAAGLPAGTDLSPVDVGVKVGTDVLSKAADPAALITYLAQLAAAAATGFAARHYGPAVVAKVADKETK